MEAIMTYQVILNNTNHVYTGDNDRIATNLFAALSENREDTVQLFANNEIALEKIGIKEHGYYEQRAIKQGLEY